MDKLQVGLTTTRYTYRLTDGDGQRMHLIV